eukprot:TRINITY_DN2406_c0_g1_i5.p1 TRINITY_DN2406_c0_g1~~TRINITY_DN2406_c0_g1_i5.p1  ORF type:complete len:158 (-),score=11.56 TRINITY_DN2406_c0_g1_i5:296-769(-)
MIATGDDKFHAIVEALNKPCDSRTENDLETIMRGTADVRLLTLSEPSTHLEFVKAFKYLFLSAGSTVFAVGEIGVTFYWILHGTVGLLINKAVNGAGAGEEAATEIKILSSGDQFGELGLLKEQHVRAATAICKEDCHLVTLERDEFISIIRRQSIT